MLYNLLLFIFYLKLSKCFSINNKYRFIKNNNFSNIISNNQTLRNRKNAIYSKVEIKMPALSSTMTTGKIVKWNINIGDYVNVGDIIMTVESDKADMDVEAFDEGFLRVKRVEEQSEANVGDILGVLTTDENESIDADNNDNNVKEDDTVIKDREVEIDEKIDKKGNLNQEQIFIPFIMSKKNQARINKWVKKENDFIKKEEVLFHVEDDKSTIEVESKHSGIVKEILVKEGQLANLDKPVAIILVQKLEDVKNNKKNDLNDIKSNREINEDNVLEHYKQIVSSTTEGKYFLENLSEKEEKLLEERLKLNFDKYNYIPSNLLGGSEFGNDSKITQQNINSHSDMKVILPSARELMNQHKLNTWDIKNTQVENRIAYDDVNNFLKNIKSKPDSYIPVEKQNKNMAEKKKKIVDLTNIQKSIKNNMIQSLNIPVFRVTHLIKTNELNKLYEKVKSKISLNVILNKCVSNVLLKHPLMYSTYIDEDNGKVLYHDDVNIGNALGLKESLLTPVLKQVDKKNIYTLSDEWKELVEKGRKNLLTANEMSDSNFYISNLGMFNTYQFDAILPKNASCILSVGTNIGSIENIESLKIQKGIMMTLTCDHRHIYGSHAALFMNDLSKFIENDIMQIFL